MTLRTRKTKDRIVEVSVDTQGTTTEILLRLRISSTWFNRFVTVLISLAIVVLAAYHPVITTEVMELASQLMSKQ